MALAHNGLVKIQPSMTGVGAQVLSSSAADPGPWTSAALGFAEMAPVGVAMPGHAATGCS